MAGVIACFSASLDSAQFYEERIYVTFEPGVWNGDTQQEAVSLEHGYQPEALHIDWEPRTIVGWSIIDSAHFRVMIPTQ